MSKEMLFSSSIIKTIRDAKTSIESIDSAIMVTTREVDHSLFLAGLFYIILNDLDQRWSLNATIKQIRNWDVSYTGSVNSDYFVSEKENKGNIALSGIANEIEALISMLMCRDTEERVALLLNFTENIGGNVDHLEKKMAEWQAEKQDIVARLVSYVHTNAEALTAIVIGEETSPTPGFLIGTLQKLLIK